MAASVRFNATIHELAIISKIVDRIEGSGYCRRRPNPDDQRSSLIELTPAGEQILAQATDVFEAELARRFGAVLSARSLEQLHRTLMKLRATGHRLDHRYAERAGAEPASCLTPGPSPSPSGL